MPAPHYVCCLLWDGADGYWFEQRPQSARLAAGKITCFGGAVEVAETPLQAIHREIDEELCLALFPPVMPVVELFAPNEHGEKVWMARFYRVYCPLEYRPNTERREVVRLTCDEFLPSAVIPRRVLGMFRALSAWLAGSSCATV